MLRKKTALLAAVVALFSLPLAHADLLTTNYTNEDSTVKITSGKFKPCAGLIGQFTSAHGELLTPWGQVRGLCLSSGNMCTAEVYMTKDCTGPVVGYAAMDLGRQYVTTLYSIDAKYKFSISPTDNTHILLEYADPTPAPAPEPEPAPAPAPAE